MKKVKILQMIMVFLALVMLSQGALAATRTLTAGSVSGEKGNIVSVPVTIDDATGIGGVNVTLHYDANALEFLNATTSLNGFVNVNQTPYPDNGTTSLGLTGRSGWDVVVALITADNDFPSTLFNANFKIKDSVTYKGTFPVELQKTQVDGQSAQVLADSSTGGDIEAEFIAGQVVVDVDTYSLSGVIRYNTSESASGCQVMLRQGTSLVGMQTADSDGKYSFSELVSGEYSLVCAPRDPVYGTTTVAVKVAGETTQNVQLAKLEIIEGKVSGANGLNGLKVKLVVGDDVIGLYSVAADGSFVTAAFDKSAEYQLYAVYGNVEILISDTNSSGEFEGWATTLYSIAGTVSGLGDEETATITVVSEGGNLARTVTREGPGNYTVENLVNATDYIVSVTSPSTPVLFYDGKNTYYGADSVDLSNGSKTNIDFSFAGLQTGTLTGKVTKNNAAVPGQVIAYNTGTGATSWASTSSSDGSYSITLEVGTYEIFVLTQKGNVYYFAGIDSVTQNMADAKPLEIAAGGATADLILPESTQSIQGAVKDHRSGLGYAGALLTAVDSGVIVSLAVSGSDGSYELTDLPAGNYTVHMDPLAGNYATQKLGAIAGDEGVDFEVNTGNVVDGVIKNEDKTPVYRAMIQLMDSAGLLAGNRMYYSNTDGEYAIKDVPAGTYAMYVTHADYEPYSNSSLVIGEDMTLGDITLTRGGQFYGTVTNATASPLAGATVAVVGTSKILIERTSAAGQYAVKGLDTNDEYILSARKTGFLAKNFSANATSGNGTQVDFSLEKPQTLWTVNGTVLDGKEQGMKGVYLVLSSKTKGVVLTKSTDANGYYAFQDVPVSTDYRLVMIPSADLPAQTKQIDLTQDRIVNFTVDSSNAIMGTVTWNNGGSAYVFVYSGSNVLIGYKELKKSGDEFSFSGMIASETYRLVAAADGSVKNLSDVQASSTGNAFDFTN